MWSDKELPGQVRPAAGVSRGHVIQPLLSSHVRCADDPSPDHLFTAVRTREKLYKRGEVKEDPPFIILVSWEFPRSVGSLVYAEADEMLKA